MNPNNCDSCDHKKPPDGGWCYMFRSEPTGICMKHTGIADSYFKPLAEWRRTKNPSDPCSGECRLSGARGCPFDPVCNN